MKTIVIKTQIELDALPAKFDEYTIIEIRSSEHINVVTARENSKVTARENSKVTARENSKVTARENSKVTAWGNSQVTAWENSKVTAWGNSQVTAWGNSQVTARENSKVTAWGNSQVTAWGNSKLHAYDCTLLTIFSAAVVVQKLLDLAIAVFEDNTNPSVKERAKTARIIRRKSMTHTRETFARRCEPGESKGSVILFKSVRDDGTDFYNETE